jgi:hypothetical protein
MSISKNSIKKVTIYLILALDIIIQTILTWFTVTVKRDYPFQYLGIDGIAMLISLFLSLILSLFLIKDLQKEMFLKSLIKLILIVLLPFILVIGIQLPQYFIPDYVSYFNFSYFK